MKTHQLIKKGISLILAVMMLSGVLFGALRVSASSSGIIMSHEISAGRVSGYPLITFYDMKGRQIAGLIGINPNSKDISYDAHKVTYTDSDNKEKTEPYSKVDLLFAYADYNYPLLEEPKRDDPRSAVQSPVVRLTYGDQELTATSYDFSTTRDSHYLITKALFAGIQLFDDYNNEVTLNLQYLKVGNSGEAPVMARGEAPSYKFTSLKTPLKDKEEADKDKEDGDVNFGNGENDKPVVPPEGEVEIKSSTPYIIVEEYSFGNGGGQLAAGSSVKLKLVCKNTHRKTNLENIIMKVTTSEGLQLTNSSNTFYISKLSKNASFEKELDISALSTAEAKSHTITVSFNYEYVADDERQKGEMSQEISIPVVQQDRFSVDPITNVSDITVGDEIDVLSKYMNKSRGEIFNLTATLECDESIFCEEKILHTGNVQAGGSGDMEFSLSGTIPGTYECGILYTYEDAVGVVKEIRVPFEVTFIEAPTYEWDQPMEPVFDDIIYDENGNPSDPNAPAESGLSKTQMILIGASAAAVLIVAAVVIVKKRKAAKEFGDDDDIL